jgi:hypothetical protein
MSFDQVAEYVSIWNEKLCELTPNDEEKCAEFEIMGYDLGANIVSTIVEAINANEHERGETNRLTANILKQMQRYPQDGFDFSESGQYYYPIIVPQVYQLSAHFLIRPIIENKMISELTSHFTNGENIDGKPFNYDAETIAKTLTQVSVQIDKAVDKMFVEYFTDNELETLYNPENDWFREFIYDEMVAIIDKLDT